LGLDASLRDSGPWVEIEQPNDRTLVIKTPVWSNEAERHLFTRAENGDLVMEVQQTRTGVDKFVIPHGDANSFYMRWTTYRPFDAAPAGAR
jgi:hypothetical protein